MSQAEDTKSKIDELLKERRELGGKVPEYDSIIHNTTKNRNLAIKRVKEIDVEVKELGGP